MKGLFKATSKQYFSNTEIYRRVFCSTFLILSFYALILFAGSGTFYWFGAWCYLLISLVFILTDFYFIKLKNPDLLQELIEIRHDAEVEDKLLFLLIFYLLPTIILIVSAIEMRFSENHITLGLVDVIALSGLCLSYLIVMDAMVHNKFYSPVIRYQKDRGHKVISSGPYQFIRHPGYLGSVMYYLCLPLVLSSMWAYIPAFIALVVTLQRIKLEESILLLKLPGYSTYCAKIKYRLIPKIW